MKRGDPEYIESFDRGDLLGRMQELITEATNLRVPHSDTVIDFPTREDMEELLAVVKEKTTKESEGNERNTTMSTMT